MLAWSSTWPRRYTPNFPILLYTFNICISLWVNLILGLSEDFLFEEGRVTRENVVLGSPMQLPGSLSVAVFERKQAHNVDPGVWFICLFVFLRS